MAGSKPPLGLVIAACIPILALASSTGEGSPVPRRYSTSAVETTRSSDVPDASPTGHPALLSDRGRMEIPGGMHGRVQHVEEPGFQHSWRPGGHGPGMVNSGGRRPRQRDMATFFNSLDENLDGVLAEEEIREFVEDVGGENLDDTSEILGGVETVMFRLDTDSSEGIGFKELSSWINRLGSILTVEEAADWVTHALQLPSEVAEAFRSNAVSGYDFLELVEDDGSGIYFDLGIKRSYRKRIVKAIEIRLLCLGDEPLPPVLQPPSYLGDGKVRLEWSAGEVDALQSSAAAHVVPPGGDAGIVACSSSTEACPAGVGIPEMKQDGTIESGMNGGRRLAGESASCVGGPDGGPREIKQGPADEDEDDNEDEERSEEHQQRQRQRQRQRADTFPVHKFVLQRSCLPSNYISPMFSSSASSAAPQQTWPGAAMTNSVAPGMEGGASRVTAWNPDGQDGGARGFVVVGGGGGATGVGDGDWVTVQEFSGNSPTSYVDATLLPGRTYVYRLIAWNLIGHSEPAIAQVTTPSFQSLWRKPWGIISPWLQAGPQSAAESPRMDEASRVLHEGPDAAEEGREDEAEGVAWWLAFDWVGGLWWILGWGWWALSRSLKIIQTLLVLAGVSANLMRLRVAYGGGGTGVVIRRNWPMALLWKLNHVITRNRTLAQVWEAINSGVESLLGLHHQHHHHHSEGHPRDALLHEQSLVDRNSQMPRSRSNGRGGRMARGRSVGHRDTVHSLRSVVDHPRSSYADYGGSSWAGLSRVEEEYAGVGMEIDRRLMSATMQSQAYTGTGVASWGTLDELPGSHGSPSDPSDPSDLGDGPWRGQTRRGRDASDKGVDVFGGVSQSSRRRSSVREGGVVADAGRGEALPRVVYIDSNHAGDEGNLGVLDGDGAGSNGRLPVAGVSVRGKRISLPTGVPSAAASSTYVSSEVVKKVGGHMKPTGGGVTDVGGRGGGSEAPRGFQRFSFGMSRSRGGGLGSQLDAELPDEYQYRGKGSRQDVKYVGGDDSDVPKVEYKEVLRSAAGTVDVGLGDEFNDEPVASSTPQLTSSTLDYRRSMLMRRASVSRLALGGKKGEPVDKTSWHREAQLAERCFSCHKPFKAFIRHQHHCCRCERVFCSKHGYTAHPPVTVCGIPGDCICDVCLRSIPVDESSIRRASLAALERSRDHRQMRRVESDIALSGMRSAAESRGRGRSGGAGRPFWRRDSSRGLLRRRHRGDIDRASSGSSGGTDVGRAGSTASAPGDLGTRVNRLVQDGVRPNGGEDLPVPEIKPALDGGDYDGYPPGRVYVTVGSEMGRGAGAASRSQS